MDHQNPHVPTGLARGLSDAEAAQRLAEVGPNLTPRPARVSYLVRVANQLRDPLIVVLIGAAVLTIVTADFADAAVIVLVIVVNTAVGVTQEARADRAVEQLDALAAPAARVVRNGVEREIGMDAVVPGDLIVLAEGEIVPADARLVEAVAFATDESMLTGEAVPVDKSAAPAGEAGGEVSAGTVVVRGRGRAVVTATGAASAMGRVAALLAPTPGLTPLQRRLAGVARTLALAAAALCLLVLVLGLVRGQPVELMVLTAISLMVAAVPESLPAVVSLALALGARRMAARQAIVRRLPAVETLGSVTLIATDKTGTLTEGSMVVQKLWTMRSEADVTAAGYAPEGSLVRDGERLEPTEAPDLVELLRAGALCTDAALIPPGATAAPQTNAEARAAAEGGPVAEEGPAAEGAAGGWSAAGDPTEAALLAAAAKVGLTRAALERELPRVAEIPFDNARKRMTTVHRDAGRFMVICKGAPEVVLRAPIARDDAVILRQAEQRAEELAHEGFRVLAVAVGWRSSLPEPGVPSAGRLHEVENGLHLLGLVAIADPPRASAADTIAACRMAGVTPVLITGDHRATARALAVHVGIGGKDPTVMDGLDVERDGVPDPRECAVFARTNPEQKLGIVDFYSRRSQVVAMTGDGVNDAPALRRADIGVAMGLRGTEVARQAADLVLADDELATLVRAVEEGRRIYANVRRFLVYGLSGGAAEILVMLAGPFLGLPLPLLPAQILWINLMTHGPPGVALGAEPAESDLMRMRPRPPEERILGAGLWQRIPRIAVVIAAVTLVVAVWAESTNRPWQSMAFLTLGTAQLGVALGLRARPGTRSNPFLLIAAGMSFLLMVGGLYIPLLRELLGTDPLPPADLAIASLVSVAGFFAARLDRRLHTEPAPGDPGAKTALRDEQA